jgi:hypothetical protein
MMSFPLDLRRSELSWPARVNTVVVVSSIRLRTPQAGVWTQKEGIFPKKCNKPTDDCLLPSRIHSTRCPASLALDMPRS